MTSEPGLFSGLYSTIGANGFWIFILVTLVIGGAAAVASGRAVADGWRSPWLLPVYAGLLGLGVRFIQFSVFEQPLFSLSNYAIDVCILLAFCVMGYRLRRATQMTSQYPWLYKRSGFLSWRHP